MPFKVATTAPTMVCTGQQKPGETFVLTLEDDEGIKVPREFTCGMDEFNRFIVVPGGWPNEMYEAARRAYIRQFQEGKDPDLTARIESRLAVGVTPLVIKIGTWSTCETVTFPGVITGFEIREPATEVQLPN